MLLFQLCKDGPQRSSALAATVCVDPSTVSRQIADLVDLGLVERRADPQDGRASLLAATEAGQERHRLLHERRDRAFAVMLADWSDEDVRRADRPAGPAQRQHRRQPSVAGRGHHQPATDVAHPDRSGEGMTTAAAAPATTSGAPRASTELSHRQILTILSGLMMGMFLAALDQTIVATSIRTIADDLHGLSIQAWATTAYLITATISTPLYGKLSDLYGRRPFFITAIVLFVVGSLMSGFADSMYQLAAFRAFQGLGAGGLFSLALTIIGDIVPPRERAKYQGYFLAVFGTSSVLGPVVGGFFAGQAHLARHHRLALGLPHQRADRHRGARGRCAQPAPAAHPSRPQDRLARRRRAGDRPRTAAHHRRAGPRLGMGLRPGARCLCPRSARDRAVPARRAALRRRRAAAVATLPRPDLQRRLAAELHHRHGHVRRARRAAALPADRQGRLADARRAAARAARRRHHGRLDHRRAGDLAHRVAIASSRSSVRCCSSSAWCCSARSTSTPTSGWSCSSRRSSVSGLGGNMQPLVLAVQNAVPPQDMGVATSSATFFRQMGGTLGTAVFLSVLFSTVGDKIAAAFKASSATPAFRAALSDPSVASDPNNAAVIKAIKSGAGLPAGALDDTSFLNHLDARLARPFLIGFSDSIDLVFLCGAGVLADRAGRGVLPAGGAAASGVGHRGPSPGGRRAVGRRRVSGGGGLEHGVEPDGRRRDDRPRGRRRGHRRAAAPLAARASARGSSPAGGAGTC